MSKLRPECGNSRAPALPYDTTLFLIRDAVARRRELIYGRLNGPNNTHCAMGAFWADNPKLTVEASLVDEVAAVNDSLPPTASAQDRWKKVDEWLRWKVQVLTGKVSKTKPKPAKPSNVVPIKEVA